MPIERKKFTPEELTTCLSHYDLGIIREVRRFPRGSRLSPKIVIETEKGKFLFKRRAKGKEDLEKAAFTHEIQLMLAEQNFPLPRLITTRDDNSSLLVIETNMYEMFEFIEGDSYDGTGESTKDAGKILARYHNILQDFTTDYHPTGGTYHNSPAIHQAIRNTVGSLPLDNRPPAEVVTAVATSMEDTYKSCAAEANSLGLTEWPGQIVHGDWHPGNMLFAGKKVKAVIDYDSARVHQRVLDLANGVLQFSIIGGDNDPAGWPDNVHLPRFASFMRGYLAVCKLPEREAYAVPYLMCEAMIAEAVLPIAVTGSFGRMEGFGFLKMIDRKVKWILDHIEDLYTSCMK